MSLLLRYLRQELAEMQENQIASGPSGMFRACRKTSGGNWPGQRRSPGRGPDDPVVGPELRRQAAKSSRRSNPWRRTVQAGRLRPEDIDPESFAGRLFTTGIPDPDLLIRTSGEYRLSNFLLWQTAYTELYFTDTLWPDFREEEFIKALLEYQQRDRRFGLTQEQVEGLASNPARH
jgi:hypothetical protein